MTDSKSTKLDSILNEMNSFVIAFSGGVDSSFLLYRAHKLKRKGITAVTIKTPYIPKLEIDEAVEFTGRYGIKHEIIELSFPEIIRHNPIDRCYLCKKTLFTDIFKYASVNGYKYVLDGTNADDTGDFRPGMKALRELGVRSPLLESGLSKKNIRELAREDNLDIWDKPAMACLLTRIPYDTEVNESLLRMIEEAESVILEAGFPGTRVRVHGDVARIECLPGYFTRMINNPVRQHIVDNLKRIGFRFVSLDLEGYRTGSSNPETR